MIFELEQEEIAVPQSYEEKITPVYPSASYQTVASNIVTKDDLRKVLDELSKNPLYEHKCQNCGGTVEMDYEKAIFICPYCGSHYALKPHRINDIGGK